jgi:hypothetical protein
LRIETATDEFFNSDFVVLGWDQSGENFSGQLTINGFLVIFDGNEELGLTRIVIGCQLNIEVQWDHVVTRHFGSEGVGAWDV